MINMVIDLSLLGLLLAITLMIIRSNNMLNIVILSGLFSLVICSLFFIMDAVDVAFTEAAVGAGISTLLMLAVIKRKDDTNQASSWPSLSSLLLGVVVGVLVVMGTWDMPYYGDLTAPIHNHLAPRFLQQSGTEIGIPNVVTSVLASYRGYDTFGEVTVIFTAGLAVYLLLSERSKERAASTSMLADNLILNRGLLVIIPLIFLFALYVQFHGDYGPGGGFQAGVIFAVGLITFGLLTQASTAKKVLSQKIAIFGMAIGVLLYAGVGIVSIFMGGEFLNYSVLSDSQTAGQHLGIFLIELGVGITVAATMLSLYYSFYRD